MKRKSNSKIFFPNLILLLVGLGVILFSVYSIVIIGFQSSNKTTVLNSLENEYYVVGKDPTKLQTETFEKISEQLENENRNQKTLADLVAQSFVIDFFNWSNKDASYDIGGLQYMYNPTVFNKVAHYEYYQKVDVFNNVYGKNSLPNITDVTSRTEKIGDYTIDDQTYPAYESKLTWNYASSAKLNTNEFVDEVELVLIDVDGKILITEVIMVEDSIGDNTDE